MVVCRWSRWTRERRLAVLDLSPGGHQPMTALIAPHTITFNGEIYNHQELRAELEHRGYGFRTRSDTEVVLAAYREWGTDSVSHFTGMFAFALYDETTRSLFLARDRAGEKPLFYYHDRHTGQLLFASELKALMADPGLSRRIDPEGFQLYLTYGYVPGHCCLLSGVNKLPPAHAALYSVDTKQFRTWRYWQLPEPPSVETMSPAELEDELDRLLLASVRRQMVADVPVGILLSGGLDSSLVTAMAARVVGAKVRTFTITFPGHGRFDEGPYARLVADHFGTTHTEVVAEPASVDVLPLLARQYDEPIGDSSIVPSYLVSRLIRADATVALGGDGGDELFGGYHHYSWILRQERARRFLPRSVRNLVGAAAGRVMPVGRRGRNYLIGFTADLAESIAHVNVYFDRWTRTRLVTGHLARIVVPRPERARADLCNPRYSTLRQATEADFRSTMVDGYLVKVDRASMLNSLEVRSPWLDHQLIEFAFGRVPDDLRATETERKILPRRLASRLLPAGLDLARKQGFSMPLDRWFAGAWGRYVEQVLAEADPSIFDRSVIQELVAGQRRGYSNTARLFALTMFELWRREYRVAVA